MESTRKYAYYSEFLKSKFYIFTYKNEWSVSFKLELVL